MNTPVALRTSVESFRHPHYGNRVDLVGAQHYGDPNYYDMLQDFLDGRTLAGAHVQYERPLEPTEGEMANVSPKTLNKLMTFGGVVLQLDSLFTRAGFVRQEDSIQYRSAWQNHDMPLLEIVDSIDEKAIRDMQADATAIKLLEELPPSELRPALLTTLQDKLHSREASGVAGGSFMNDVIIDKRNTIALDAMDQQERRRPGTDFVLFWGDLHGPGLRKGLWQRGFKMTRRQLVAAARY